MNECWQSVNKSGLASTSGQGLQDYVNTQLSNKPIEQFSRRLVVGIQCPEYEYECEDRDESLPRAARVTGEQSGRKQLSTLLAHWGALQSQRSEKTPPRKAP